MSEEPRDKTLGKPQEKSDARRFGRYLYGHERSAKRGAKFLLTLSLALGVAALVALECFTQRIENTVRRDGRTLLAADYVIQAWREFPPELRQEIATWIPARDRVEQVDFTSSAVLPSGDALTVSVRALGGEGYPFYGDFRADPAAATTELLAPGAKTVALLDPSFRARGVKVGDPLQLGQVSFRVLGFISQEPQALAGPFALGPRVIIPLPHAAATGLLGRGARASHGFLVRSALNEKDFRRAFRARVPDPHWRLQTPERANRQAQRISKRIRYFLAFVGLTGLFLGGVGLFVVFRSQFLTRLPQFLTLRCLGAPRASLLWYGLYSSLPIAATGWALGLALGALFEMLAVRWAQTALGMSLASISYLVPAALGAVTTLATVAVAVLLPLREILRVPVAEVIRESDGHRRGFGLREGGLTLVTCAALTALVGRDLKMGALFFAALAGTVLVLAALTWLASRVLARAAPRVRWFAPRHALLNFTRRPGRSQLMTVSLGLGCFLVGSILLLAQNLRAQLDLARRDGVPNLFMIGIPADQIDAYRKIAPPMDLAPVTQARIVSIKGVPVAESAREPELDEEESRENSGDSGGEQRFYQTREYTVSRKLALGAGERVVQSLRKGQPDEAFGPPSADNGAPLLRASVEESFARSLKLQPGDRFEIQIAGVPLTAEVRSLRKVDWFEMKPNFFLIFQADDLADAPMDYAAFTRVPGNEIASWQSRLIGAFPQVTVLDGQAMGLRLRTLLDQLALSVLAVSLFSVGSCLLVFIGITVSRENDLVKEFALWRCLGVERRALLALLGFEALITAVLAASIALLAATGLVLALDYWVLDIPFVAPPPLAVLAFLVGLPALLFVVMRIFATVILRRGAADLFRAGEAA